MMLQGLGWGHMRTILSMTISGRSPDLAGQDFFPAVWSNSSRRVGPAERPLRTLAQAVEFLAAVPAKAAFRETLLSILDSARR